MALTKVSGEVITRPLVLTGNASVSGIMTVGTGSTSTTIDGSFEYPTIRPTLDLNFAATKTLDRRITFTRDSLGTYTDELGVLKYAPNNSPRFDHDPDTGESLGLLIEESRTNLVTHSEDFSNSAWTENGASESLASSVTAPDGTTGSVYEMIENSATSGHFMYDSVSVSSNTNYTWSVWMKANTRSYGYMTEGNTQGATAYFNLSTGTVNKTSGTGSPSATAQKYPNGWVRCTMTFTTGASQTSANVQFGPNLDGITFSYAGDGSSGIYVWGAQGEAGSFPTSYIPTSGSTVTRAVDLAKITGTNFTDFYNSEEFTLYGDGRSITGESNVGGSAALVSIDDNTGNYRFILRRSNGTNQALPTPGYSGFTFRYRKLDDGLNMDAFPPSYSGSSQYDATGVIPSYWTDTSLHKMVMSTNNSDISQLAGYGDGYSANFANTGNGFTGTETLTPYTQATQMQIGNGASSRYWNGQISSIKYYPKRLPNAQLQGLTSQ